MAQHKKIINYEFVDGPQQLPATYIAICTITGEQVPIYHKILVKMIENKYKNNFDLFIRTYVSPNAKRVSRDENDEDPYKLNVYADYLIITYRAAVNNKDTYQMQICADRFEKHFKRSITSFIPNDLPIT